MWPQLDMAPRALPQAHAALTDVRDAKWRALDFSGNFFAEWRSGIREQSYLPSALELSITLSSGEQYTRLFTLPAGR